MVAVNAIQKDYNKEIDSALQKCKDINLSYSEFGAPYLAAKIASLLSNGQKERSLNSRSTEPTVQLHTEKTMTRRTVSRTSKSRERGLSPLGIQSEREETTPSPA
jgi:hypothetical protein